MTLLDREHEQLGAFARAYGLLARLVLRGADGDALARLRSVPGAPHPASLDAVGAEHHRAFHLEAFPQAGVFLSTNASAGAATDLVGDLHRQLGFSPRLDDVTEDHLGVQLAFLSFATAAGLEAAEDGDPRAARIQEVLVRYLDDVVLRWAPALVVALRRSDVPFWTEVVELAVGLAAHHRHLAGPAPEVRPFGLPPEILDDEQTGLRRIARFLLTPAECGALMTRSDITGLGRAHGVPRGFGPRLTLLENLLRSAVELGELRPVSAALREWALERADDMATLGAELGLASAAEPWIGRLHHTARLMQRLGQADPAGVQAGERDAPEEHRRAN